MLTATLSPSVLNNLHPAVLAHAGDAVYELYVRTYLSPLGFPKVNDLHKATVRAVCAPAQAAAFRLIEPLLSDEEAAVYRRARNTHHARIPHGSTPAEYSAATGLEALFGWLYLSGNTARCDELFETMLPEVKKRAQNSSENAENLEVNHQ